MLGPAQPRRWGLSLDVLTASWRLASPPAEAKTLPGLVGGVICRFYRPGADLHQTGPIATDSLADRPGRLDSVPAPVKYGWRQSLKRRIYQVRRGRAWVLELRWPSWGKRFSLAALLKQHFARGGVRVQAVGCNRR